MESLGDILKKTQINISKVDTGTSSAAEAGAAIPEPCPLCRGAGFVYIPVPADHPDFGKVMACQCTQRAGEKEKRPRLEKYSSLGSLLRLTFENLSPRGKRADPANQERFALALQAAQEFAQNPQGWLVLVGPSGSGKTHLAAAIVNRHISLGQPALFIVVPDLLDHLRSTFSPQSEVSYDELFHQVRGAPFLVLDDLGSQTATPWAREKLFQIINQRYNDRLPTVITALSLDDLEERLRTRLEDAGISRVCVVEEKERFGVGIEGGLEFLGHMTFDKWDKRSDLPLEQRQNLAEAYRLAWEFSQEPQGWLVLQGVNGCGKTHLAAAIANHRLRLGKPVLFITVPELLDHLRSAYSPQSPISHDELFERLKKAPLLILDDFGEQSSTPWAQAKLYQLISHRYNARLPTVVTTSLALEQMESRFASRLADVRLSTVWNITAPDYRVDRPVRKGGGSVGRGRLREDRP